MMGNEVKVFSNGKIDLPVKEIDGQVYFDDKALNRLYDWWQVNGSPDIHYWLTYDGCLTFFRKGQLPSVARIVHRDNGTCFLDYDAEEDPFTPKEHRALAKFVRVNNAD